MNIKELIEQISTVYYHNKNRKIGQTCKCPICHKEFVKKTNKQVFCGSRYDEECKNAYHNFIRYGTIYDFGIFLKHDKYKITKEETKEETDFLI